MGKRKRSWTVDIGLQNGRTSNAASASNAEMEQNLITQSGAQLGPSNGSPVSDHELDPELVCTFFDGIFF